MSTTLRLFADTNIFIYSLFNVDKDKHERCKNLFDKANSGDVDLWTTEWVISEVAWFLRKRRIVWNEAKKILEQLFQTKGLEIRGRNWLWKVIEVCSNSKDFNDVVNIYLSLEEGINQGYSYDKGLDKWTGFERLEP